MAQRTILLMSILALSTSTTLIRAEDPATTPADLVIWGGKIITVDPARPEVEAVAAIGERLVALGNRAEIAKLVGPKTEIFDLKGAVAYPGLIEAHGHFLGLGDFRSQLDLTKAQSWSEIVTMVKEATKTTRKGGWIRGRGWHQEKWQAVPADALEGFPVHHDLSKVSPDHPVMLTHASGHMLMANAKAMDLAKVNKNTADPPGGDVVRDGSGKATGIFNETAQDLIDNVYNRLRGGEDLNAKVKAASDECLKKGITSFQDAGLPLAAIDFLKTAALDRKLGVRLWVMIGEENARLENLADYRLIDFANHRLTVRAIKRYMDGALGSRGAWLLAPYADQPSTSGLKLIEEAELKKTAELAVEHGFQLCTHAIGDRANRTVLDIYQEAFEKNGVKDQRWRIEHAQHLDPADQPRFQKLGVIASMQAIHAISDGPWVPERIDAARAQAGAYPWRNLLDSGAVIINGTDTPVEDVDPIPNFHAAVTRRLGNGEPFYPAQKMTRQEALEAMTIKAAWGAFEEKDKGSLELGKLADLTILTQNLLTVADDEVLKTEVVATVVGGKVVYRRP